MVHRVLLDDDGKTKKLSISSILFEYRELHSHHCRKIAVADKTATLCGQSPPKIAFWKKYSHITIVMAASLTTQSFFQSYAMLTQGSQMNIEYGLN